jgi:hypothetical protein
MRCCGTSNDRQHRIRQQSLVAAVEQREAAFGCAAVANSVMVAYLKNRVV